MLLFINPIYSIVQRVSAVEISVTVVRQLGAKLVSTDRGQASEVAVGSCSFQIQPMVHVKNVGGGPGDEDPRRLPRLPTDPKGKATKKIASKKHKYPNAETARAAAIADATDRAERGGARSGVVIVDHLAPDA